MSVGLRRGPTLYTVRLRTPIAEAGSFGVDVRLPRWLRSVDKATSPLATIATRDASSLAEVAAKNVIYEIIDSLVAYRLLRRGAAFLHAAGLERDGQAIVFTGSGGVGKSTSLLAAMSLDDDVRYLADDLLVVDRNGSVARHPKHTQIYQYNLSPLPELQAQVIAGLSTARRSLWATRSALLGPKQARVRLSPETLFGSRRVANTADMASVFWVMPARGGSPRSRPIPPGVIAERTTAALLDEIWDFARLLNIASLMSDHSMALAEFTQAVRSVHDRAFAGVGCFELTVPYGADPEALVEAAFDATGW
jgi:hypothetical protein